MMKQIIRAALTAFSAVLLLSACEATKIDDIDIPEGQGSIVGSWHLQELDVVTETTINGSVHKNSNMTDFTKENCRLIIGKKGTVTAQYNFEIEVGTYTYDQETLTIHFRKGLSVSDNGKAMVLVNDYTAQVDEPNLVLIQKDLNVNLGSLLSGNERAIYHFRREADKKE